MTLLRKDIIRMAREAGITVSELFPGELAVERFAYLVAAAEREAIADMVRNCDSRANPKGIAAAIRVRGEK